MTTITTEEAHKLWRALFDANWHKAAGALRSLAAERDALKAENARLLKICDDYSTKIYLAQAKQARHLAALEPRIARQRRALAKLYQRRHDRKAENARLREAALDPAVSQSAADLVAQARRVALFEARQRALLYANTSYQHGHLPVNPHECAAQVAMEIAGSITGIDPDIRKAGYAFRRKVLEAAAQKAEIIIATEGPWSTIPEAIRALKGEGDE